MLFLHLCKIFSFTFCVFLYIIIYTLNIIKKRCLSMKAEASWKTIISELDFLKKAVIINETLEKKIFIVPCKQINRKNISSL